MNKKYAKEHHKTNTKLTKDFNCLKSDNFRKQKLSFEGFPWLSEDAQNQNIESLCIIKTETKTASKIHFQEEDSMNEDSRHISWLLKLDSWKWYTYFIVTFKFSYISINNNWKWLYTVLRCVSVISVYVECSVVTGRNRTISPKRKF